MAKNNYTYALPELQKFEDEMRASLGLAPIKRIENNPEEKKSEVNPGQQTKKSLDSRALIDSAWKKVKENQEVEMFEKDIRASFNLK